MLESQRWKQLQHAYGEASNIPNLLEQLRTAPPYKAEDWQADPWYSLWSCLCHQNDVYTASYAAVPHLVAIAQTKPPQERLEFVRLMAWIETCRSLERAVAIPTELKQAYFDALSQAASVIIECLMIDWDQFGYQTLFGGLVVFRGQPRFGAWLMDSPDEWHCPNCGALFPVPGHNLFEHDEGSPE